MKNRKLFRKKKEDGQSLVEFVLVLPLFALILMGIIDFGWMFYNYIGIENASRNAARIACVEYSETNYNDDSKQPYVSRTFDPNFVSTKDYYKDEEVDIVKAAMNTMPSSVTLKSVDVSYTYDADCKGDYTDFIINKRSEGDVKVTVHAKMKVLTPVLGVFSDNMMLNVSSTSTYKVEKMPADSDS